MLRYCLAAGTDSKAYKVIFSYKYIVLYNGKISRSGRYVNLKWMNEWTNKAPTVWFTRITIVA